MQAQLAASFKYVWCHRRQRDAQLQRWADPFTTEQEALDEARMGAFAIVPRAGIRAYSYAPSCRLPF
jgi:hypothetical protein